jgi:hypothetical protein
MANSGDGGPWGWRTLEVASCYQMFGRFPDLPNFGYAYQICTTKRLVMSTKTFGCAYLVSITKYLVSLEIYQTFWLGK